MDFIEKKAEYLYESSSGLSKSADQFGFGYPFLSYSDVFHNYYAPQELNTLVNSNEHDRKQCSVKRGDVFLTRTSETTEELGMSCVALMDYQNATFNGFTKRLRPITDEIVPEYAAYFFRSPYFRAQCMSMASLITRASLNDGMIKRFLIRYPKSKEAQLAIGQTLMNYDRIVEINNRRIRVLEQIAESLYKEWFIYFRFPGHENEVLVQESPKGWAFCNGGVIRRPATWHYGPFSELGSFIRGKNLTAADMEEGQIPVISAGIEPSGYHSKCNVKGPCITISASGANAGYLKYNLNDIWAADCSYYKNDHNIWFAYSTLKFLQPVISNLQNGAAQPHVQPKQINSMSVLIPPEEYVKEYCDFSRPLFAEIETLEKQNTILLRQRDLLLPRLMSGRLEM